MKGYLIVNAFLNTDKFQEIHSMLINSFKENNVELIIKTNIEMMVCIQNNEIIDTDFVLFWDKDVLLAKHLEKRNIKVFNNSKAIEICDDKGLTAVCLQNYNIPMPKTILAPFTYQNIGYTSYDFLNNVIKEINFPIVIKENKGSFGKQVYLANDYTSLLEIVKSIGAKSMLFQEFIKESNNEDVRIYTINKKYVLGVKRIACEGDFRANVTNGGSMVKFDPPKEFIELAEKISTILDVDFAGVDLMFGKNGKPVFCEINSNAHFKNVYNVTGVDLSKPYAKFILESLK